MIDAISRQEFCQHLRRIIDSSNVDGNYNEGFNDGLEFAISHAATMPSAYSVEKGKSVNFSEACDICVQKNIMCNICMTADKWEPKDE